MPSPIVKRFKERKVRRSFSFSGNSESEKSPSNSPEGDGTPTTPRSRPVSTPGPSTEAGNSPFESGHASSSASSAASSPRTKRRGLRKVGLRFGKGSKVSSITSLNGSKDHLKPESELKSKRSSFLGSKPSPIWKQSKVADDGVVEGLKKRSALRRALLKLEVIKLGAHLRDKESVAKARKRNDQAEIQRGVDLPDRASRKSISSQSSRRLSRVSQANAPKHMTELVGQIQKVINHGPPPAISIEHAAESEEVGGSHDGSQVSVTVKTRTQVKAQHRPYSQVMHFDLKSSLEGTTIIPFLEDDDDPLCVLRMENLNPVPIEPEMYGRFCLGDVYIVVFQSLDDSNENVRQVFCWRGPEAAAEKAVGAAIWAVAIRTHLCISKPIRHQDGHMEDPDFLDLFAPEGIIYEPTQAATPRTLRTVSRERQYRLALYQIFSGTGVVLKLVRPHPSSLMDESCFILDNGLRMFVWIGTSASYISQSKAVIYAHRINSNQRLRKANIEVFHQGDEPEQFFNLLQTNEEVENSADHETEVDQASEAEHSSMSTLEQGTIYEINIPSNQTASVSEAAQTRSVIAYPMPANSPSALQMSSESNYVVDVGNEIFWWVGGKSNGLTRDTSMDLMQQVISQTKRPSWFGLQRMFEGHENEVFKLNYLGRVLKRPPNQSRPRARTFRLRDKTTRKALQHGMLRERSRVSAMEVFDVITTPPLIPSEARQTHKAVNKLNPVPVESTWPSTHYIDDMRHVCLERLMNVRKCRYTHGRCSVVEQWSPTDDVTDPERPADWAKLKQNEGYLFLCSFQNSLPSDDDHLDDYLKHWKPGESCVLDCEDHVTILPSRQPPWRIAQVEKECATSIIRADGSPSITSDIDARGQIIVAYFWEGSRASLHLYPGFLFDVWQDVKEALEDGGGQEVILVHVKQGKEPQALLAVLGSEIVASLGTNSQPKHNVYERESVPNSPVAEDGATVASVTTIPLLRSSVFRFRFDYRRRVTYAVEQTQPIYFCNRDVYFLNINGHQFLWSGEACGVQETLQARQFCEKLLTGESNDTCAFKDECAFAESEEFVNLTKGILLNVLDQPSYTVQRLLAGSKIPIFPVGSVHKPQPRLFQLIQSNGQYIIRHVYSFTFLDLPRVGITIIDLPDHMYIWKGREATDELVLFAVHAADLVIKKSHRKISGLQNRGGWQLALLRSPKQWIYDGTLKFWSGDGSQKGFYVPGVLDPTCSNEFVASSQVPVPDTDELSKSVDSPATVDRSTDMGQEGPIVQGVSKSCPSTFHKRSITSSQLSSTAGLIGPTSSSATVYNHRFRRNTELARISFTPTGHKSHSILAAIDLETERTTFGEVTVEYEGHESFGFKVLFTDM